MSSGPRCLSGHGRAAVPEPDPGALLPVAKKQPMRRKRLLTAALVMAQYRPRGSGPSHFAATGTDLPLGNAAHGALRGAGRRQVGPHIPCYQLQQPSPLRGPSATRWRQRFLSWDPRLSGATEDLSVQRSQSFYTDILECPGRVRESARQRDFASAMEPRPFRFCVSVRLGRAFFPFITRTALGPLASVCPFNNGVLRESQESQSVLVCPWVPVCSTVRRRPPPRPAGNGLVFR